MKLHNSLLYLATATVATAQTINIVAHEDDDLLFINPDISGDIASGRSVRTIFLTAGDAGNDESYWLGREEGSRAAYAQMSDSDNSWSSSDVGIDGYDIPIFTLNGNPDISLVFLRLPDGNNGGEGFGRGSLQQLWLGDIDSLESYTGSSYSRDDLLDVIRQLVDQFDHDRINTLDFVNDYGQGDHSDHYTTGHFVHEAIDCGEGVTLASYLGYPVASEPANIDDGDLDNKKATFYTYAGFDRNVCASDDACSGRDEAEWVQRSYVIESEELDVCDNEDNEDDRDDEDGRDEKDWDTVYERVCPSSRLIQQAPVASSVAVPTTTAIQPSQAPATPSDTGAEPTQILFDGGSMKSMAHSAALCILAAAASAIFLF